MIEMEENQEILAVSAIIDGMERCSEKFHTLTYEREKFIRMVKCYLWHLQEVEKSFEYQAKRGRK
jgi:hypothetical protein